MKTIFHPNVFFLLKEEHQMEAGRSSQTRPEFAMDLMMIASAVISSFCVYAAWGSFIAGIYPGLFWGLFFGIARRQSIPQIMGFMIMGLAASFATFSLFILAFNAWGLDVILPISILIAYFGLGLLVLLFSFRRDFFASELGPFYWLLPLGCAVMGFPYIGIILFVVSYQLLLSRAILKGFA